VRRTSKSIFGNELQSFKIVGEINLQEKEWHRLLSRINLSRGFRQAMAYKPIGCEYGG
jgi:hypothetical protein